VKLYQARQQRLAVEWVLANGGIVSHNESGEVNYVSLSDTQITDAGRSELKAALPNCEISFCLGN
jgi:hypothetical protein